MNLTRSEALQYRRIIEEAVDSLTDEQALKVPMLFEHWKSDMAYKVGKRVCYEGVLYSVLIAHTSQSNWTPDISPSLFAPVLIPDPAMIPDWVQPESTNPYMMGDKVKHNGKTWQSTIDNNVWEPGIYGWDEIES